MPRAIAALLLALLVAGVAVAEKPASPLETAEWHVRQGKRLAAAGQIDLAISEFGRALELNGRLALAYALRAVAFLDKQDLSSAGKDARKARRLDGGDAEVLVCYARWASESGRFESALRAFGKAKTLEPGLASAWYFTGLTLLELGRLEPASSEFEQALQLGGPLVPEAAAARKHVAALLRGAPEGLHRLGPGEPITRAELAVLLVDVFSVGDEAGGSFAAVDPDQVAWVAPDGFRGSDDAFAPVSVPGDVSGHWAETVLYEILRLRLRGLSSYPGGKFYPDLAATRAEFALVLEDLYLAHVRAVDVPWVDLRDLPPDHFAYRAALLALDLEALQPGAGGGFDPDTPVTGAEALLGLRALRSELSVRTNR